MSLPSVRSILLKELTSNPDGTQTCNVCRTRFSGKSDSSAWRKHFQKLHPVKFACMVGGPDVGGAHNSATEVDAVTEISSLSSPRPQVKKRKTPTSGSGGCSVMSSRQSSLTTLLGAASSRQAVASLARLFAHSSISHHVVSTPEFHQFMQDIGWGESLPTRSALKSSVLEQAQSLRLKLAAKLRATHVTIAADGWTNIRHDKVTNVCVIANGVAYYWCSIVNVTDRNDAAWLSDRLSTVIHTLINEHSIHVAALVVDNEAVNKAAYNLMKVSFPFLIHVPCAAHTVQLVVRSCLQSASFSNIVAQLNALIRYFDVKEHRHQLKREQLFRNAKLLSVLKPNDTRWSSTLIAAERILLMRRELENCFSNDSIEEISSKETFFVALVDLCAFLQPFRTATDALQSDHATLITVYEQFATLLQHTKAHVSRDDSVHVVLSRWQKRINVAATMATAVLSFVEIPPALLGSSRPHREFIREFGTDYLVHYKLCGSKSRQEVSDELLRQFAQFLQRTGPFSDMEDNIGAIRRSGWNSKLVWSLYSDISLATVAIVLLSLSASEAAVERTFSAQAAVHTKKRNRLHSATVEAEMFIKFNYRLIHGVCSAEVRCAEMDDDFDAEAHAELFEMTADDEPRPAADAPTTDDDELASTYDSDSAVTSMDVDQPAAAAAGSAMPSSSDRRRARREVSVIFTTQELFIEWFIGEHCVTSETHWNADLRNSLLRYCSRVPPPCPTVKRLEELIRASCIAIVH